MRTIGVSRTCTVWVMRLLPGLRVVGLVRRRGIDTMVHPAVPTRRNSGSFRKTIVNDPALLAVTLPVVLVAELVLTNKFTLAPGKEAGAHGLTIPPGEDLEQEVFHPRRVLRALCGAAGARCFPAVPPVSGRACQI